MKITEELQSLFKKVRIALGAPVRQVPLTDESLCALLEMCIEDYAEKVQSWLVETQWATLYGKDVTNTDMAHALSLRTLDMSKDYSYWFSKEVGLQQRGPWELKKDFITIEQGKQNYLIPAGREVNRVMYVAPPTTQAALFANYGGLDLGFGGGFAQVGNGAGAYGPVGGFYTMPAADVAYLATDLTYKNRLLRGDLSYKITAGPNGTRILHLMNVPGSKLSFGFMGTINGGIGLIGCQVWYTYYDTTDENADECRLQNPDVLITPDQVPLSKMDYSLLNEPTKVLIRQLLVAKAKENMGLIQGRYSGKVSIARAELLIDYQMLLNQGKDEWTRTMEALEKRLERMSPANILKAQADIAQSTMDILKYKPLMDNIKMI